ncbi:MAG: AmmeMemoRadiSam system protein B [Calditrichaceae bacterium]|nr:AmmeMemoRadiSam system protein B [Calditrichaceae bacterium]
MRLNKYLLKYFLMMVFIPVFCTQCAAADNQDKIHKAMVAGSFYPADPAELKSMVDQFLANAGSHSISGQVLAIISPHAGYVYSAHVAAEGYALLRGKDIKRVIIISPTHVEAFRGVSIYDGDAYETPLGRIPVDKDFAEQLSGGKNLLLLSSKGHETKRMGRGEHALEVQLPFLQSAVGEFSLVPIVMGDQEYETCRALGLALADLIKDDKTLIVASSDLSHFHKYDEAKQLDSKVINSVLEWDYFNLHRNLQSGLCEACGGGPIISAMIAAEAMGANEARLLKYANSGDVSAGDKSRVVGYASIALIKSNEKAGKNEETFSLSKKEQRQLLEIAKEAVELRVKEGDVLKLDKAYETNLLQDRAAFVTLKINHQLRGCIGYTSPISPLIETVRNAAIQAATQDPRFRPVTEEELKSLTYEISVLSPFRKILDLNEIEVGIHGLLVKKGNRSGLLLPQVPVEQSWDRQTFIEQTCRKAGLPTDAWKDRDTDIFGFIAFVFGEND